MTVTLPSQIFQGASSVESSTARPVGLMMENKNALHIHESIKRIRVKNLGNFSSRILMSHIVLEEL